MYSLKYLNKQYILAEIMCSDLFKMMYLQLTPSCLLLVQGNLFLSALYSYFMREKTCFLAEAELFEYWKLAACP